jgi:uncharacterized Zn-binding protein involved in type VI secretion
MVTGIVPHVGGPILPPAMVTVLIGGLPAARVTDMAVCVGPPDMIVKGAMTVLIGNMPAARIGDMTVHGGTIVMGCPTVMIGESGGGGGGGGSGGSGFAKIGAAIGALGSAVASASPGNIKSRGLGEILGDMLSLGGPNREGFATVDDAGRAALTETNPLSIRDNLEYGGLVYKSPDGTYGYTSPIIGSAAGLDLGLVTLPAGTTEIGTYHTHGDYSIIDAAGTVVRTSDPARDDFNSDNFSFDDILGDSTYGKGVPGYRGFLGTPGGVFKSHDPNTGIISVF